MSLVVACVVTHAVYLVDVNKHADIALDYATIVSL